MPRVKELGELKNFERALVTFAFGVDALTGADPLSKSGRDHFIIDTWTSGLPAPEIYSHPIAFFMRANGGVTGLKNDGTLREFLKSTSLYSFPNAIRNMVDEGNVEPSRRAYLNNIVNTLEHILHTLDPNKQTPDYDARYSSVTGYKVASLAVDSVRLRKKLEESLKNAGFEVTAKRGLRESVLAWEKDRGYIGERDDGTIDGQVVKEMFLGYVHKLLNIARERRFKQMNFGIPGYAPDLSDVPFDGFEFEPLSNVEFTGSSIYRGGGSDVPELKGLLEYNTDHELTKVGLVHLAAHEVMIGHYFNSAVADLLYRAGKLPFESTMGFMCAPSTTFQEGWAENALAVIYGSEELAIQGAAKDFGVDANDLRIAFIRSELQNVAKHNVSFLYQKESKSLDSVREHVRGKCVQNDSIVEKLSGGWATSPLTGPLYGPAYLVGSKTVGTAITHVGAERVAEVGLQTTGRLADIKTFRDQIWD